MNNIVSRYVNEVLVITPYTGYILYCSVTNSYHEIVYLTDESNISNYIAVDKQQLQKEMVTSMNKIADEQDSLILELISELSTLELNKEGI